MSKSLLSEVLRKASESYVKRLPYIFVIVLVVFPLFPSLGQYSPFQPQPLGLILLATFLAVIIFHFYSIRRAVRRIVNPEKIVRFTRCHMCLLQSVISIFFILLLALAGFSVAGVVIIETPFPLAEIADFLFSWFFFFFLVVLFASPFSLLAPYTIAKLCFQATSEAVENLLKQKNVPLKDAYRRFKWLKLGFQSCNDFLIEKAPHTTVANISQYNQQILSLALVGDAGDLKKLSTAIQELLASLGNTRKEFHLRRFLVSLQLILGKKVEGKEISRKLADMLVIRPSLWDRTKMAIRSPYIIFAISVVALLIAFFQLMFQVLY